MFGECIDFAPAPARGRGKQKPLLPPSQVPQVVQLTPQEQANQLANTVGLDPSLMKGCPPELLQGITASDLRVAVRYAVNQVQQGRVDTEKIDEYLSDFLSKRIALLPLATRFPLLAEWSGKPGDDLGGTMPLAFKPKAAKVGPEQSSFISFDSLPGGSYPQEHAPIATGSSYANQKVEKPEKASEKKTRKKEVQAEVQEEDTSWQKSTEITPLGPSQVRNAKVARAFLETITTDSEALEKDRAVRREQEAKRAASKVMVSFEQTKAAVEAGLLAAKRSQQLLRGDVEKKSHAESVAAAFSQQHVMDAVERADDAKRDNADKRDSVEQVRLNEQSTPSVPEAENNQGADATSIAGVGRRRTRRRRRNEEDNGESLRDVDLQDHGGRRRDGGSYDEYGGRRRYRDDSRERLHDEEYDRGGRFNSRADYEQLHERRHRRGYQDYADSRSRSRSYGDGKARRRFRDGDADVPPSDRRRIVRSARSRSRDDRKAGEAQKSITGGFVSSGSSGKLVSAATPAAKSGAASDAKITAPGAFSAPAKPEPKLRILACKGTWAEYVDQDSGEHVYKNVLTNEMTKKKPAEFGDVISDAMNQRRLSWLAGQRNAAMLGDMRQMQQMQQMQMQQRPPGFM